jgi:hypothetical protein
MGPYVWVFGIGNLIRGFILSNEIYSIMIPQLLITILVLFLQGIKTLNLMLYPNKILSSIIQCSMSDFCLRQFPNF